MGKGAPHAVVVPSLLSAPLCPPPCNARSHCVHWGRVSTCAVGLCHVPWGCATCRGAVPRAVGLCHRVEPVPSPRPRRVGCWITWSNT